MTRDDDFSSMVNFTFCKMLAAGLTPRYLTCHPSDLHLLHGLNDLAGERFWIHPATYEMASVTPPADGSLEIVRDATCPPGTFYVTEERIEA
jgi:hypothetical protein